MRDGVPPGRRQHGFGRRGDDGALRSTGGTSFLSSRITPARTLAVALAVSAAAVTGACGSSSASAAGGSKLQQSCTAVGDVLADGPDPDADPVGYAQAQVLPLSQLKISDAALAKAVKNLASSYQAFSSGATKSTAQLDADQKAVNAICPGAAG